MLCTALVRKLGPNIYLIHLGLTPQHGYLLRKQGPIHSKQDYQMSTRNGSNSAHDTQELSIFSSSSDHCQAQLPRVTFLQEQKRCLTCQYFLCLFTRGMDISFHNEDLGVKYRSEYWSVQAVRKA